VNRDLLRAVPRDRDPARAARRGLVRDLCAVAAAALLVVTAVLVGRAVENRDGTLHVNWPPLLARWGPHLGPGTPAALAVAVLVVAYGPGLAARLPWRALLGAAWGAGLAWTWSLALVDGWHRGIAGRLTTRHEYLQAVDRFGDIPRTLRDFAGHILLGAPDNWPAHVAGHPPAATVTFVLLDRIGLGGGAWAGAWCITVGTTAAVAVLVAVRALADETLARRAAPFLVLAPAAVWVGTSADGYFAAVAAWAVAFLALAVTGRGPAWTGFIAGLLFGLTAYLSYGLTLVALIAAAVLLLGTRRARPLPFVLAGTAVVPAVFTAYGFDWWEAYHLLVRRYYQGVAGERPYAYWVWANLACTALVVGPATVAGLRRAGATRPWRLLWPGTTRLRRLPWSGTTHLRRLPWPSAAHLRRLPWPSATHPRQLPQPSATHPRQLPRPSSTHPWRPSRPAPARSSPLHWPDETAAPRLALLVASALLALLIADLSGMSKAETERIWLPFAVWLLPACAFLTGPRAWLATQATLALLLNHLLLTGW
jgi:hypothetical protein